MSKPTSRFGFHPALPSALPRAFPFRATMPPLPLNTLPKAQLSPLPAISIFFFAKCPPRVSRTTTPSSAPYRTTNPRISPSNAPNPPLQKQIRRRPPQQHRRYKFPKNPEPPHSQPHPEKSRRVVGAQHAAPHFTKAST